jgi:hypothetical protein
MNTESFIQKVASGEAAEAKDTLSDLLSNRAFEALDMKKQEIATTLYSNGEDIEVQDTADTEIEEDDLLTQEEFEELSEEDQELYLEALEQLDELKKSTLQSYYKKSVDSGLKAQHRAMNSSMGGSDSEHKKNITDINKRVSGQDAVTKRLGSKETMAMDKEQGVSRQKSPRHKPTKPNPKKYSEEVESLEEKNVPTSPEKWSRAKAMAKQKFDVYPSAYANGWASKKYKEMGGGWKSVSEEKKEDAPFTPDTPKKKSVVVGKKPEGYSRARQLARQAVQKYNKPVKEEKDMSKKAQIVKNVMKKDKFEADPVISKTVDDKES